MILDSLLPDAVQNHAALLAAQAALSAQASALAHLVRRLEALRRTVPTGDADFRWHGAAHSAYSSSVRELGGRLDEAIAVAAAAHLDSRRALTAIDARVR